MSKPCNAMVIRMATKLMFLFLFLFLPVLKCVVGQDNGQENGDILLEQKAGTWDLAETALDICQGAEALGQAFLCQNRSAFRGRHPLPSVPCDCDIGCLDLGNCCFDRIIQSGQELHHFSPMASCLPWAKNSQVTALMIDRCPRNYKDSLISNRCLRNAIEGPVPYIHTQDLPFHSLATKRTYANQYCALCHNDSEEPMTAPLSVVCKPSDLIEDCQVNILNNVLTEENYIPHTLEWRYSPKNSTLCHRIKDKEDGEAVTCQLEIELDLARLEEDRVRFCNTDIVSTCSDHFPTNSKENLMTENLCSMYSLGVDVSYVRYKNPHCAKCNFVSMSRQDSCYLDVAQHELVLSSPGEVCSKPGCPIIVSITVAITGNFQRCAHGQFWSLVYKQCYDIACGANFILEDGQCVTRLTNETDGTENVSNATVNRNCFLIEIDPEYIEDFGNGTILLTKTNTSKNPGEYETFQKLENGQVSTAYQVCREVSVRPDLVQGVIGYIAKLINIVALSLHILLYCLLKKLRNQPAHYLFCLSLSMLLADLAAMVNSRVAEKSVTFCLSLAIFTHYFLLAQFYWTNILSFDVCRTFAFGKCLGDGALKDQGKSAAKKRLFFYSCYAWGMPLLLVLLTNLLPQVEGLEELDPGYSPLAYCMLSNVIALAVYFILPIFFIILGNLIFFLVTMVSIIRQHKNSSFAHSSIQNPTSSTRGENADGNRQQLVKLLTIYVRLSTLMGMGWFVLFIGVFIEHAWVKYCYTLIANLQGVFIFVSFDLKPKVRNAFYEKTTGRKHPSLEPKKSSSSENEQSIGGEKKSKFVRNLLGRLGTQSQSYTISSDLALSSISSEPN